MRAQPYLYSPNIDNGSPKLDFNPRAYSQATYEISVQGGRARPERLGPLIDLNRESDVWAVTPQQKPAARTLPPGMRKKICVCRWIQFGLRVLQLISVLGLFACVICLKNVQTVQIWLMRIPVSQSQ